jgi:hypothetical protein
MAGVNCAILWPSFGKHDQCPFAMDLPHGHGIGIQAMSSCSTIGFVR